MKSNNTRTRRLNLSGDQTAILVAGVNSSRESLYIKNVSTSTDSVEISVGYEPADWAQSLIFEPGTGFEWYSGSAPLGPVYVRSASTSGATIQVMGD